MVDIQVVTNQVVQQVFFIITGEGKEVQICSDIYISVSRVQATSHQPAANK